MASDPEKFTPTQKGLDARPRGLRQTEWLLGRGSRAPTGKMVGLREIKGSGFSSSIWSNSTQGKQEGGPVTVPR